MTSSRQLAGLIGPTLVVVTSSEGLNLHIFATNIPPVTYLNGTLLFIAGLAIVRAHSRWTRGWPVLVTLVGWVGIIGGLLRMFFPEAEQGVSDTVRYASIFSLLAVGVFLTLKAYAPARSGG